MTVGDRETKPLKPFWVLWTGQSLSLIGTQAVQFALIWWLTRETGSASVLALATFAGLMPPVLLGPAIGAFVDRWSRKAIMLVADLAIAGLAVGVAVLFWLDRVSVPWLLAFLLARGIGAAFHAPAMTATTSLMVPERHLARIQGINQSVQGLLTIVAAPLGALLIALLPMAGVMMVDVVTACVAVGPLLFVRVPRPQKTESVPTASGRLRRLASEIGAGLGYLRSRRGSLTLMALASLINLCLVPAFALLPLLVLQRLGGGAARLAWMESAVGVGMLVGGVALGVWGGFERRVHTALTGVIVLGLAVASLGLVPAAAAWPAIVAMLIVGASAALANGPIQAVFQSIVPGDLQGRVFTLLGSLSGAMTPIGLLLASPIAEVLGVRFWYLAAGTMCVLVGAAGFLLPSVAHLEATAGDREASNAEAPLEKRLA